ncbi:MAG TPA: FGGY-family carbohydrate kinase [Stellaceae bacterium]|nr:FGGY-family carbohydrate kinase [Stellaceae bacterium]
MRRGNAVSDLLLAVDVGGGSLRAAAVSPRGGIVRSHTVPLASTEPRPGWSEFGPELWWKALATAVGNVLHLMPRSARVQGVAIAGLTRSQVLLDESGTPLRPAILFRDRRAVAEAVRAADLFLADNPADAITAFHPLARLAWVAEAEPAIFRRLHAVLEPKDFLNRRLTGRTAGDTVSYSRFDAIRAKPAIPDWAARSLELLAVERIAPWGKVGTVTVGEPPFDRLAGVPVFGGSMDAWATAVGSGALLPDQGYDIAGTTEVAGLITSERAMVPGLVSLVWGEDVHQIGGPTQAGADCARWCRETLRIRGPLAAAVERAGRRAPSEALPLFLPYLDGERAPVWRADVRGAFHNISRALSPDEFLWATLEGVAHAVRDILQLAGRGVARNISEIRVSGGGAASEGWCQMKADVLGLPVVRTAHAETGLIGCAIAASVGLGIHRSLAEAAATMSPAHRVFEPQASLAAFYAHRASMYRQAKDAALALGDGDRPKASAAEPA